MCPQASAGYVAQVKYAWQHQADLYINIANPISGTPYPVLVATEDVRLISISAAVVWTVQPSPKEVHVIVDGNTITFYVNNPVSGIWDSGNMISAEGELTQNLGADDLPYRSFLLEGHNVAVSTETTGGTVQNLYCRVKWSRLLPT